jgi:hypothetical protein
MVLAEVANGKEDKSTSGASLVRTALAEWPGVLSAEGLG